MSDDPDSFIKGIGDGDPAALEWLARNYYEYVVRLLRRHSLPPEVVEDLSQDVFVKFCRNVREGGLRFELLPPLLVYLQRCAFTVAVDHIRKQKQQPALLTVDDPDEPIEDPKLQRRDDQELRVTVLEILSMLSPEEREIIVMVDVNGKSHAEAARLRGVTEGTSKNQLSEARRRFRELYHRRQGD